MFTNLVMNGQREAWMDGQTEVQMNGQVENIVPPPAGLAPGKGVKIMKSTMSSHRIT